MKNVFIVCGNRGTFTTVPVTRLLGAILLAIVIDATMVATIPVMTIQQTAKAYTYCSRTRRKVQVWLQSWLPRRAKRLEFTTLDTIKWWG
ncbi:MAG: hypothetical protein WBE68_06545 [Candidatus Nitrosopolaris sp.]